MRPLCPRCQRPLRACLCQWVVPTLNRLPLLVLQHPQEATHAKGTVRLLRLCLAQCQVEVGERFDAAALGGWLGARGSSVLLFPDAPGATGAAGQQGPAALPQPVQRLVLLDGTWRQARRLLQANPLLQALPRCALQTPPPSRYAIRRAQRPEQRSSLEAACLALGALEARPAHYAPLLAAFSAWVASPAAVGQPGGAEAGKDACADACTDALTEATMAASASPSLAA